MQMGIGAGYLSTRDCLRRTREREGWVGLTRGLGATIARETPGNAIFFTVYEVAAVDCLLSCICMWTEASVVALTANRALFCWYGIIWHGISDLPRAPMHGLCPLDPAMLLGAFISYSGQLQATGFQVSIA